ncbi:MULTISPECIES: hypothetical protein [Wolbachia]|uniref:hypothetical protein n=1 Tax=Wolbachia TaxID=953 RepID=UPI001E285720|nr:MULTISPECIES: hypothetical protein [Wolbachia]
MQEAIAAKMNPLKALHSDIIDGLEKGIQDKMSTLANTSKAGLEEKMGTLTDIKSLKFEGDQGINELEGKMEEFSASGIVMSGLKHKVNEALIVQLEKEKQDLEAEVEKLKAIDSTALQQQLEEKNAKITELEALDAVALQQKLTEKENEITALKAQPDAAVTKLEGEKTTLTNKIKDLEAQLSNRPDAAQLKDKEDKIKELEAKNKTTEQPKQGNGARYTATVGMGLAAGLIAFTALERTVRLDIWVMVGIAVVSTLAVGSITYAALPSTQVNGAEVQGVSGGKTRQLDTIC